MKIAIPVIENKGKDSMISEHFGHAPFFAFISFENDEDYKVEVVENPMVDHGPGDLPEYLYKNNVNLLIVRGIGARALQFFSNFGIQVVRGAEGTISEIVEAFQKQILKDRDYQVKDKYHH